MYTCSAIGIIAHSDILHKTMASGSKRYIALDVECVATGRRHDDRDVCLVAVVNANENVIYSKKVKPDKPVVSYLTPLTGVKYGDLDKGDRLPSVIKEVKALLGPDVVLVGQGVKSDIKWLQLEQGKDFDSTVDLGEMFKTYNSRYGNQMFFSLSHEANTLLHSGFISEQHNCEVDAIASIKLFNKYNGQPGQLEQAKKQLMAKRPSPSFAKKNNYKWEGVCMAAYMPSHCICGAPTLKTS